jgi:ERCC4-type nuclease
MHALIDDREVQILNHALTTPETDIISRITKQRLVLGDILLCHANEPAVCAVFERKRMDDLLSSLRSGHMQEQLARLVETKHESWIVIEDNPADTHSDQRAHVFSWMIEILTDPDYGNIRLVSTTSVRDTWLFVYQRASMLVRSGSSSRLSRWNPPKRRHLSVYTKTLLGIPGVSFKRARSIQDLYPTLLSLCSAVHSEYEVAHAALRKAIGPATTSSVLKGLTTEADYHQVP